MSAGVPVVLCKTFAFATRAPGPHDGPLSRSNTYFDVYYSLAHTAVTRLRSAPPHYVLQNDSKNVKTRRNFPYMDRLHGYNVTIYDPVVVSQRPIIFNDRPATMIYTRS